MSRFHRAWWPGGAPPAAIRLTRRSCLAAAAVAVWALGPASSLGQAAGGPHSRTATSTAVKPHAAADVRPQSDAGSRRHHGPLALLPGTRLLRPGAGFASQNGSRSVAQLQRQLALAGDHPGPLDGRFGPLTEAAVIRFQTAHGLPIDGTVGPLTAGALRAGRRALAPGAGYRAASGSSAVRVVQRRLAQRGFDPGPIDGRYGPLTMRAVAHFQRARHLTMTGIAGVRTRLVLTGSTQRRHPTISPVSAPVVVHPSPERQQLPLAPAAGPAGMPVHVPALPIAPVLLGLGALGLMAVMVSYSRTRRRVRKLMETGSRAPSRPPGAAKSQINPGGHW